jgi:serine protease Do
MKNGAIGTLTFVLLLSIAIVAVFFVKQEGEINDLKTQTNSLKNVVNPQGSPAPSATGSGAMTMVDLIHAIQPVIVRVDVSGQGFQASGSGIIIRNDGYVITNAHVIEGETSITITLNNTRQYPASVKSNDSNLDLAILKITGAPSDLPVAVLGTSSDVIVGGTVTAAGFPLGSLLPGPASFTRGIVSAVRNVGGSDYIQSDVAINPGSSGGALVTNSGKVIGITTSEVVPRGSQVVGIGLAIPIDVIQSYIDNNLK